MFGNHLLLRTIDFVTDAAWLFWFGGLTFYMAVVVPIGGEILGNDVQGEVTSQVTGYINITSLIAAALIFMRGWRRSSKSVMTCAAMIATSTLALIVLRYCLLERMLGEATAGQSSGEDGAGDFSFWLDTWSFYSLHRVYLWITTFQWLCGVIILWNLNAHSKTIGRVGNSDSVQSSEISL